MPFARNSELPARVRNALPVAAQTIFRRVFNSASERGVSESGAFRQAWSALRNAGWEPPPDGAGGGAKWRKVSKMAEFRARIPVEKIDSDERLVFGFASIVEEGGEPVFDFEGDAIAVEEIEKAAYEYLETSRTAGEMHVSKGCGHVVESFVLTKAKADAMRKVGVLDGDFLKAGWWIGYRVTDEGVWKKVQDGTYSMFSIGGSGERVELEEA